MELKHDKHGNRWNHDIDNIIINHMSKPNRHHWGYNVKKGKQSLDKGHCSRYFIQIDLYKAVLQKYPNTKYDTFLRHLRNLEEKRMITTFHRISVWVRNKHVTPVRLNSLRKKGLKYRNLPNSYSATCDSITINSRKN